MSTSLRANPVLIATDKAAQVQLPSGKRIWFPYSQCPDLDGLASGEVGEFSCPQWMIERENLEADAIASSRSTTILAHVLQNTREAAFVKLPGGEEVWLLFEQCQGLLELPINTVGYFQCPSYTLDRKELSHYTYSLRQIAQHLHTGNLSLSQAICTYKIAPSVLHQFAHDSAYKVLQCASKIGTGILLSLWKTMQCKRQWLKQECDTRRLEAEREELQAAWGSAEKSHLNAVAAVWKATQFDPILSAEGAAYHMICGILSPHVSTASLNEGMSSLADDELRRERQWQSSLLASQIENSLSHNQPKEDNPEQRQSAV